MSHINEDVSEVTRLLTLHANQVSAFSKQNNHSLSVVSESVLRPILKIVFDLKELEDLNKIKTNYPSIDLGDTTAKVCIQITSSTKLDKIKSTINKFLENSLQNKFDRLIIYFNSKKNKTYSEKAITKEVNGKFKFNPSTDLIDYSDLASLVSKLPPDKVRRVLGILKSNFEGGKFPVSDEDKRTETLILNWMEINVPEKVYLAQCQAPLFLDRV